MTNQMQRLLSRVDGVQAPIEPVPLVRAPSVPASPSASRRAREAHRQALRMTRETAVVLCGRVPRAVEALMSSETSDVHDDLLAAGLL
jgi:hypothetical protein